MHELRRQQAAHSDLVQFVSPYNRGSSQTKPEYPRLIQELGDFIAEVQEQAPATSGGIKRSLEEPPPASTNAQQHTSEELDRQQPKRAKKEEEDNDTSHIIDLTFSSSSESEDSDSEVKEVAGPAKSKFAPAKGPFK